MKNFTSLDFIGMKPGLYINQSERHKTKIGAFLTIIISIFSILVFFDFGLDMLGKKNPSLFESKYFNLTSEMSLKMIPFMLGLMKIAGFTIPDLKRNIQMTLKFAITNSSNSQEPTIFTDMALSPCKESAFSNKISTTCKAM